MKTKICFVVFILVVVSTMLYAQRDTQQKKDDLALPWSVVDGGNSQSSSSSFGLKTSACQISVQTMSSSNFSMNTGYMPMASYIMFETGAVPVQIATFVGIYISGNTVKLEWETISEINNFGFYVQKFNPSTGLFVTIENSFQSGKGTTLELQKYSWTDKNATGDSLQYRLKQIDNNGLVHYFGPITLSPNSVDENKIPTVFKLSQNYPNPFNPTTVIKFDLPTPEYVTIKIYNLLGQEVITLVNEIQDAGYKSVRFGSSNMPSGIYYYRIHAGKYSDIKKMLLVK